jgi:hypothetical protein
MIKLWKFEATLKEKAYLKRNLKPKKSIGILGIIKIISPLKYTINNNKKIFGHMMRNLSYYKK